MLWKPFKSAKLFSDFNNLQFAGVTGMVLFVILLLVFLMQPPSHIRAVSTDLPKVSHSVSMPGANREDAILIRVTRDGRVYLDADEAFGRWHKTAIVFAPVRIVVSAHRRTSAQTWLQKLRGPHGYG